MPQSITSSANTEAHELISRECASDTHTWTSKTCLPVEYTSVTLHSSGHEFRVHLQVVSVCMLAKGLALLCLSLQALKHYGESVRLGHKAILQSLPRLLTLYFEFGSKVAATKTLNQRMRAAQTQVGGWLGGRAGTA